MCVIYIHFLLLKEMGLYVLQLIFLTPSVSKLLLDSHIWIKLTILHTMDIPKAWYFHIRTCDIGYRKPKAFIFWLPSPTCFSLEDSEWGFWIFLGLSCLQHKTDDPRNGGAELPSMVQSAGHLPFRHFSEFLPLEGPCPLHTYSFFF